MVGSDKINLRVGVVIFILIIKSSRVWGLETESVGLVETQHIQKFYHLHQHLKHCTPGGGEVGG